MHFRWQLGSHTTSLALILAGAWLMVRQVWQPPAWLLPLVLAGAAVAYMVLYLRQGASTSLVAACMLVCWAAFGLLTAYLPGGLPWYLWFAFLGLGCLLAYGLLPLRPAWPLIPAALLLGLATVFWILDMSLALLPVLLPVGLIAYGVWLVVKRRENRSG